MSDQNATTDYFTFVTNVRSVEGDLPLALVPGHVLRRASEREIALIKESMSRLGANGLIPVNRWEFSWNEQGAVALPPDQWRYFVVSFRNNNQTLERLRAATYIARTELEFAFSMFPGQFGGTGFMAYGQVRATGIDEWLDGLAVDVTAETAAELRHLHERLLSHDKDTIDVERLALQLGDLKHLHPSSKLRFLGMFAILESLLTHLPKPTDPYDSITRQVKTKLALLDNRWAHRIDYGPFGGVPHETIWSKMYGYRSKAAHGGPIDFAAGELRALVSANCAHALLSQTVKAVLRHALVEPQLLSDLKNC